MIRIQGRGALSAIEPELFPGSIVFLNDGSLIRALEGPELRERIRAANEGGHAIIWVGAGKDTQITAITYGDDGRVVRPLAFGPGLKIAAGSSISGIDSGTAMIRLSDTGEEVVVPLEGSEAGIISYSTTEPFDYWIRYFFYQNGPPKVPGGAPEPLDGFRFRLFAPATQGTQTSVRFNPNRPFDPRESYARPTTAVEQASNFRTRWGAVVTLTAKPPYSSYVYAYDPALNEVYWTLDGFWDWGVEGITPAEIDLMPGYSGTEYVKAPAAWVVRFVAGAPAFAHLFQPPMTLKANAPADDFPLVAQVPGISEEVTTPWLYVLPAVSNDPPAGAGGAHAGYYSQPSRAPLFTPEVDGQFLQTLPLEAASLPPDAAPRYAPYASFPAAPYAGIELPGVAGNWLGKVGRFETDVLAAARTKAIYSLTPPGPLGLAGTSRLPGYTAPGPGGLSGPNAVTPQGLLSIFSPDNTSWQALVIAQTEQGQQWLCYTDIHGKLREALLANQLFLVVSNVEKLYQYCSTPYSITTKVIEQAKDEGAGPEVLAAAGTLLNQVFDTRQSFDEKLKSALGTYYEQWGPFFIKYAELARLTIAGWTFDLASWQWRDKNAPTILIIKFAEGDVESLVNDRSRWTLPGEFNDGDGTAVQQRLIAIINSARERVSTEPALQYFVETVLANEQSGGRDVWNGVLYLNGAVPAFPPELAALVAGVRGGVLRAHHLGVTLTSFNVSNGSVYLADTSLFGLILYDDPEDLIYQGNPYDYKVRSLHVRFANSTIALFTSQIELLVGQLFNELANLQDSLHGDNILLDGTLQQGTYRFATSALSRFKMTSHVLDAVTVTSAQFVTLVDQSRANLTVGRFILNGSLEFRRLGDFDLFGFGPGDAPGDGGALLFSNLFVSMEFNPIDPAQTRRFGFLAGQMVFDLAGSQARSGSLPRRFPLQVLAMRQAEQQQDESGKNKVAMPPDLGFIPVESPLISGSLGQVWFGLEMTLSFGSPGALAPKLGFSGALLAAWAPSLSQYNVAIGIRLPGSEGGKKALTIMGPLKLNIGRLNFLYDDETRGYLLRLQNIALSFLGLSFPPGGKTNALLFGDPDPKASNSALGWYVAYKKDAEKKDGEKSPPARLLALPAGDREEESESEAERRM